MKNLTKILTKLSEPWLTTPQIHKAICDSFHLYNASEDIEVEEKPPASISGEIGLIHIEGVMTQAPSAIERLIMGAMDTDDITRAANAFAEDDSVSGVLLDIDSGGGSVGGVIEAARAVRKLAEKKAVVAYSGGAACSAAYWVASQADLVVATDSARLGSLGVYLPFLDASKAFEQEGLALDLITNREGVYKGAGYYGTALSEEQRDQMQLEVQEIYDCFMGDVQRRRGKLPETTAQGQTFIAKSAKDAGLIDVVGSGEDSIELLFAEIRRRKRAA